jgi:hypothetical protein
MITGFFCTWLAAACAGLPHQTLVGSTVLAQCGSVLALTRNGQQVGAYVDDTLGPSEQGTQACAGRYVPTVYAGEAGRRGLPLGLVEWYPVLDHRSAIGQPPPPGEAGYILQSFSWGDNLIDGAIRGRCSESDSSASCAARYSAPDRRQLRQMWCRAKARRPAVILWYYAGGDPVSEVFRVMRTPCSDKGSF